MDSYNVRLILWNVIISVLVGITAYVVLLRKAIVLEVNDKSYPTYKIGTRPIKRIWKDVSLVLIIYISISTGISVASNDLGFFFEGIPFGLLIVWLMLFTRLGRTTFLKSMLHSWTAYEISVFIVIGVNKYLDFRGPLDIVLFLLAIYLMVTPIWYLLFKLFSMSNREIILCTLVLGPLSLGLLVCLSIGFVLLANTVGTWFVEIGGESIVYVLPRQVLHLFR